MNKKVSISKITDYDNFKCSADKCKFTCCKGWDINVDKNTFNKWKSEENKFNYILQNLKLKETEDKKEYFLDKYTHETCPLLDKNGLCKIVKNHGDEYISLTCQTFPRIKNILGDRNEFTLSCCCPEVLEIISNIDGKINMICKDNNESIGSSLELKVREALVSIIQHNGLALEYKLIICFQMLLTILENVHIQKRRLFTEIEKYKDKEYITELQEMYSKVNLNIDESIEELNNLFLDIVENYREVSGLESILEKISSFAEEIEIEYLCEQWDDYKGKFEKYNEFIENCIVSKVLASCNSNDIEEVVLSFEIIILEYLLIRYALFLKYCISEEEGLDIQSIKDYVVVFSRVIGNNTEAVIEFINEGFSSEILEVGYICFISLY
ncbi:flagellin lysine-N-methylase [Clostridium sp. D53t1_180928_C8]|uniref:flagellin lysine-N-methylase n=1 Tax=Clostridium sp. D53t1_180928_C8 TaxID=2787101 RepID=UPI0018AB5A83|nr:flagellin lysine-N-methylase [Clostridium sp. D53t1_180928_C8]